MIKMENKVIFLILLYHYHFFIPTFFNDNIHFLFHIPKHSIIRNIYSKIKLKF